MGEKQLAEVTAWKERNAQIREWLLTHPHRIDACMWSPSINLTEVLEQEFEREIKNTRSGKRASVSTPIKDLFVSIIPHFIRGVVVK